MMASIIKRAVATDGIIVIEIYDKNHKTNVAYNYLVEVSINGRTTPASKTFENLEGVGGAEEYYAAEVAKGTYIESV